MWPRGFGQGTGMAGLAVPGSGIRRNFSGRWLCPAGGARTQQE